MNQEIAMGLEVTKDCACGNKMVRQYSQYTSAIDSRKRMFKWWCACKTTIPGVGLVLIPVLPIENILDRWKAVNPEPVEIVDENTTTSSGE